jgi:hypothetical protein
MRWQATHYRPTLELLEQRDLPTTAVLSGGYLYITSNTSHAFITVAQNNGRLSVAGTSISVGSAKVGSVSTSQVKQVVVYAYGGGDVINLRPSAATTVTVGSYIYLGRGYNQAFGGSGSNYIVADSSGHNTLNGYTNTDYLAAGSPTDTLNGGSGFNWFYYPYSATTPFINGEHVSDIKQGNSPSCQTDAALAEAVQQHYNFANNIHYLGSGQYRVDLFGGTKHETISFNGWYNSQDPTPTVPGEFWTVLMYRARLESLGIDPTKSYSESQWDTINRNDNGALYSVADSIYAFTGKHATFVNLAHINPYVLQSDLAHGDYVVVSSVPGSGATSDGIVRDHAYAVLSVYYQGGMWKVQLYNPWGFDSVGGKTIESLSGKPATNLGFITVSWSQFSNTNNFLAVTVAPK